MAEPALFDINDPDPWEWWRAAEANPDRIGKDLTVHPDHPQLGYYRVRRKEGDWEPVAIFRDVETGILQAERSGRPVIGDKINELWLWCCRQPITYEEWERATTGGGWADEPEKPRGIGDNIREADARDGLYIEWMGEKEQGEEILSKPITDSDAADRAAIWADRLMKISKRADAQHTIEKAPVAAEVKRIDDRWRELREMPAALARRLKAHQKYFLLEQDRKERERMAAAQREADRLRAEAAAQVRAAEAEQQRQREEALRAAAEARRLESEGRPEEAEAASQEAASAVQRGKEAMIEAGAKLAEARDAEREAVRRNPSAGRTHARTKLVTYKSAMIEDVDALFGAVKGDIAVVTVLQQLADRAARNNIALAGCRIVEERRPA